MSKLHQISPGEKVDLSQFTTRGKDLHDDRKSAEKEFAAYRQRIAELQPRLYAERKQKLLIVLQAMDAGGKDSTTRHVFEGVNPQGVHVVSFKAPSSRELAHDYLWRIHQAVPPKGMIHIFNRSHYEDVLVVRVDQLIPENEWQRRYDQINQFEKFLTETGTKILKFYLHISKEEQKERFQDRLDEPEKHWKFSKEDLEKRKQWDEYRVAFNDALTECSTEHAPWHVIPADQKWYRNWAISKIIFETLEEMNPQFPAEELGLDKIVIE
jgi:PPK2 family polyphosphate:nucleotide phosphotransferase